MPDLTALLSPRQHDILNAIRSTSNELGIPAYLVGGAVRDWLLALERIDDLDFVFEGDAIVLAHELQRRYGGEVQPYERFRTATWRFADCAVDLTTARKEHYPHPAALPEVTPTNLQTDLLRRDFTINAMAMRLSDMTLIDPLHGQEDLQRGVMRVLHPRSFIDDPTRLLRGARYAARFHFAFEPETREALREGLTFFKDLSGERVKYDLELNFEEPKPDGAFGLLREWDVFRSLGIPVPEEEKLRRRFARLRKIIAGDEWNFESLQMSGHELIHALGWGALTYNMGQLGISRWVNWIPFEAHIRDALVSLGALSSLSSAEFWRKRSRQSELLHHFSGLALLMGYVYDSDPLKRRAMLCEWKNWRWVRAVTTGDDLRDMGIPPGPIYARLLSRLRDAWLDEEITSLAEEQVLLRKLLEEIG
jgi:tRNA nucleotidyltransferase (CCA-adding enzyme)